MKFWPIFLFIGLVGLTACGVSPAALPTPLAPTATAVVPVPTPAEVAPLEVAAPTTPAEPAADAPAETTDWLTAEGKTTDGLAYLGNPDAPITIKDYSDFL